MKQQNVFAFGTSQQNNNQKSYAILGNALAHALLVHLFH